MADENEIIINTKISADGLVAGTKELEAACQRAATSAEGIGKKAQQSVQASVRAIEKQNQAYSAQSEKIKRLQVILGENSKIRVETDEYKSLIAELESVDTKLIQVSDRAKRFLATGGKEDSRTFKQMLYDAELLEAQYQRLAAAAEALERTGRDTQPMDTSALQSQVTNEQSKLSGMQTNLEQAVNSLEQKLSEYNQKVEETENENLNLKEMLHECGLAAKELGSAFASGVVKALGTVATVAKAAGEALLNLAKKGLHAIANGAKKAASGFAGLVKKMAGFSGDSGKSSLGRSLTTMLKYGLGIRSLYALTNKLRSALTDGMNNLKAYSNSANQSITAMSNSVARLKNSIAAAFSPILSIVAPIVTKLINLLATAISYIGAFFAALSGKSTYTKAIASTEGVAGALDDAAGAAGGAADAMDDYLSGLDEIHKFDDGSSGGGGGGGGGSSGGSTGVLFEEAEIPGLVNDWADKFKAAWEQADFTEIGTVVGTKLKNALDDIPWAEIQEKCNKIATSVATFINGFVATPGLWDTVGRTIGEGINTAVGMYNTFMDTTNFVSIGNAIATTLGKTLKTTDWTATGKALTQKLRAAIETMYGFVTTFDFGELGDSIAEFINGAINNIPADKFGTAIGTLASGIVTTIGTFIQNTSPTSVSSKITLFIRSAIASMNLNNLGATIASAVNWLVTLIGTAITNTPWYQIGSDLASGLSTAIGNISWEDIGTALSEAANALIGFLAGAIINADWKTAGTALAQLINRFVSGVDWNLTIDGFFAFAQGMLDMLVAAIGEIDWITLGLTLGAGIFNSFNSALEFVYNNTIGRITGDVIKYKDATAAEIADAAADLGVTAGTSSAAGLTEAGSGIVSAAADVNERARAAAEAEWADIQSSYTNIGNSAVSGFDGLPGDFETVSGDAYGGVTGAFDNAESDFETVSTNIVSAFDKLPKELQTTFKKAYTNAKGAWKTAKSDFSQTSASIISSFSNLASGLKIKFTSAFTAAKEAWNSAKSSFSTTSADIISAFSNLASGVKIKFNSAFTEAKNAWSGAKSAFTSIANNVVSAFSGVASGVKSHFATACNGITSLGWYSAGAAAAKSVVNGMYAYSPSGWCSWFVGKIYFSGTYNIGYNLTAGIIRGMYSTSGLGSWASWFVAKVAHSLGVNSPSTIMRDEVGVYLGEGIGVGLEKSTGGILKTVSGLADKIVNGFQDGVSGIVLDSPTLAGGAFSGISYKYPVLASGTVLPPQVVYSTQKADTSDIVEQLKALVSNLSKTGTTGTKTAASNVIHNVVQINRRTLYEEMCKEEELVHSQSGGV